MPQERESLGLGLNKGVWGPAAAPDRSVCGEGRARRARRERPFCCFVLAKKKTHTQVGAEEGPSALGERGPRGEGLWASALA